MVVIYDIINSLLQVVTKFKHVHFLRCALENFVAFTGLTDKSLKSWRFKMMIRSYIYFKYDLKGNFP